MAPIGNAVFATLLMNDAYLPGAMVLGHSLRDKGAKGKLVAFVLLDNLSENTIPELKTVYDDVIPVQKIVNTQPANLYLMNRPDLISTFTKIELWKQTQYRRIVYLDADMVGLRAPNELLSMNTRFAAVPDIGWPDCFNSGMMVLNPNMADYYALLALAQRGISFDGADQGLLNMHFTDWERLSFTYNCTPSGNYQYVPAYRHFQSSISMVHFIGKDKPWTLGRENKFNQGVYGELQGRWWAVYDRHYRQPKTADYLGQSPMGSKRVQDFVHGEETNYLPGYSSVSSHSQQASQPLSAPPVQAYATPGIHIHAPPEDSAASMERPLGDQPAVEEQIRNEQYEPTPTIQQRRFSAPHSEWEPARQPPPANSKPEAANFPTQIYEMSQSRQLFEPPTNYPEPPKDMWYSVPEKSGQQSKQTSIFPWEANARKATRVFPRSREPSPPSVSDLRNSAQSQLQPAQETAPPTAANVAKSTESAAPPSPPHSKPIFPWETRGPKATRVFPHDTAVSPPQSAPGAWPESEATTPSGSTDITDASIDSVPTPKRSDNPWDSFQQQTNAWDGMPEISRYMEAVNRPRKAKIQVLHHTPSEPASNVNDVTAPSANKERRPSLILTDFPSAFERPSLPVTPAPIRRPSFWGEERDQQGQLPAAEGVPKQEEWNPTAKLEELQRRQSEILNGQAPLEGAKTPPKRDMPDSQSKEEVIEAVTKATSPERPRVPKSILKEPHFEIPEDQLSPKSTRDNTRDESAPRTRINSVAHEIMI